MLILSILLIWLILWLLYLDRKFNKYNVNFFLYPACAISYTFTVILYIPALGVLLTALKTYEGNGKTYSAAVPNLEYFNENHIYMFSLSIPSIILLILGSTIYRIFAFNPSLSFTEHSACLSSFPYIIFHIVRTLLLIICVFGAFINSREFITLFVTIILFAYYCYRFNAIDIYNKKKNNCMIAILALSLWISILNFVGCYFETNFSAAIISGILFGGIIMLMFTFSERIDNLCQTLIYSNNDHDKIKSCTAMGRLVQECLSDKDASKRNIVAFYSFHYSKCKYPFCPITQIIEKDQLNPDKYKKEMLDGIINNINRSLKNYVTLDNPNSVPGKLFYFSFLVNLTNNYIFAWELQKKIKLHNLSLLDKYTMFYTVQKLKTFEKEIMTNNNKQRDLDPVEVLKKLKYEKRLTKLFENVATEYGNFWDILQDKNPNFERFLTIGKNVININNRINVLWKKLLKIRGTVSLSVLRMYTLYCQEILMDKKKIAELADMHTEGINAVDSEIRKMQFEGVSEGIIAISTNDKSHGKITMINNAACSIIGYPKNIIKDKLFTSIIPPMFREAHEKGFWNESMKLEGCMEFHKERRDGYLKTSSGYILPVDVAVVDSPSVLSQYSFIGKLRVDRDEMKHNVIHILTDKDMIIQEISSSIFFNCLKTGLAALLHLSLSLQHIMHEAINIKTIIPEIEKLQSYHVEKLSLFKYGSKGYSEYSSANKSPFNADLNADCYWKPIHTKDKSLLGLYFNIKIHEQNNVPPQNTIDSELSTVRLRSIIEYSYDANAYYISHPHNRQVDSNQSLFEYQYTSRKYPLSLQSSRRYLISEAQNSDILIDKNSIPLIFKNMVPALTRIYELTRDTTLIQQVKARKSYSKGITLYRVSSGTLCKIEEEMIYSAFDKNTLDMSESSNIKTEETESIKYMKSTLKNKEHISRAIKSIPLPQSFKWILLISVISILMASAIAISQYFIYANVTKDAEDGVKIAYHVPYQLSTFMESSMYIVQALAVLEYFYY